ncbi:MAG: hypothetical protein HY243_07515 [Proteobacteria bacterium]|nr:hypothetical protein [Pseudomonadota bacterium]
MAAIFISLVARADGLVPLAIAFGFFLPAFVLFSVFAWMAWRGCIILHTDRIVKFNGFWSRTILRSDIRGGRKSGDGSVLRIVSRDGRVMILLLKLLKDDETAAGWFDEFDDLDALDFHAAMDRVSQDERLGSTPEKRVARILCLRRLSGPLYWSTFVVFMWALIWPRPFLWAWVALASLPVIAVVLDVLTRGGVRYDYRFGPNDARPTLVLQFFLPGLALPGMVFYRWNILDLQELLAYAGVLGSVAALALAVRSESLRRHLWPTVLCAAMLFGYAAGLMSGIDVLFDRAAPARFPVHVLGVRQSDHFDYVRVGPWGPRSTPDEVRIPGHLIHPLRRGDRVCVYLSAGRLDFRWYGLGDC